MLRCEKRLVKKKIEKRKTRKTKNYRDKKYPAKILKTEKLVVRGQSLKVKPEELRKLK